MANIFQTVTNFFQLIIPSQNQVLVTPSDTTDLTDIPRALYVSVGGTLKYTPVNGSALTITVYDGQLLPFAASRIWSTGTTATIIAVI
ncbi:MAG: hypothetical protein HY965_02875 [Ignavibacteriales bacterium]|nr:hypothetical protein [Ignavibacteriales bacterium]